VRPDVSERYFESESHEEGAPALDDETRPVWGTEDGAAVLRDVLAFFERHLAASDETRVVLAVWAAHTHAFFEKGNEASFGTTPYLHITSAEVNSGKSRVLELLDLLCRKTIRTSSISLAATFRAIDKLKPTLLLDEVDNLLADRMARGELLGILNDGYRRGGKAIRMGGKNYTEVEEFEVFCPKAFAGLRELPTVALKSRCLRLEVKPRKLDEPGGGFIFEDEQDAGHALRDRLGDWTELVCDELRGRRPERIAGVSDRTWECVRPLVVIADAAGGEWPERLRAAVVALVAESADGARSSGVRLLADIWRVFGASGREDFTKAELLDALRALEDAPYAEWADFNTNRLSRKLRRYGIPSNATVHDGSGKSHRGWKREHFAEAWERWVPVLVHPNRAKRANGLVEPKTGDKEACGEQAPHGFGEPSNPHGHAVRTVCTVSKPLPGDEGFRDHLNRAHAAGFLTDRERLARRLLHDLIVRARPPAREQATFDDLRTLLRLGVDVDGEAR
jgi:hypothetical protein